MTIELYKGAMRSGIDLEIAHTHTLEYETEGLELSLQLTRAEAKSYDGDGRVDEVAFSPQRMAVLERIDRGKFNKKVVKRYLCPSKSG